MSVEHVTQRILNIRLIAAVAIGIYVNNHPFPCEIFHHFKIKYKKGVISVATAGLARHFNDIKMGIIISMGWG